MTASYFRYHMDRTHGIVLPQNRGVGVGGGGLETYRVSFPRVLKLVPCLVYRFPERANKLGRLREHLMHQH